MYNMGNIIGSAMSIRQDIIGQRAERTEVLIKVST